MVKTKFTIFLFILFIFSFQLYAKNNNIHIKKSKTQKKKIKYRDKLLEKSNLYPDEVYPNLDLNPGPEYLEEIYQPLQYKYKLFIKSGIPVYPMFTYMKESGMDTFSGDYYLGLGVNVKNPVVSNSSISLELFISSFSSGYGAGLSYLSSGLLSGDILHRLQSAVVKY